MHAPLIAHLAWPGRRGAAEMVPNPAAEVFVLVTLATLFFILAAFATWMWLLWRRAQNPPPHVRLLMELQDEEEQQKTTRGMPAGPDDEEKPSQPWERAADWWKKPE
ncbi:MAG: hypothetical protein JNG86_12045 [Verrucomicrobiaceae bacterium]|nr:hypothetical protein [Verrucomicrobiaceae bacterium]